MSWTDRYLEQANACLSQADHYPPGSRDAARQRWYDMAKAYLALAEENEEIMRRQNGNASCSRTP